MRKLEFNSDNRNKFPWITFLLLVFFYFIGIFISDFSRLVPWDLSVYGRNILENDKRQNYAMVPEFRWQNQVFTYNLIHFAIVHYAYLAVLMLYYVQGLEKATNKKFILITYFLLGVIWPIIMGPILFMSIRIFPQLNNYVLKQSTFLGSSVAVWGQIGMTVPISNKRRLYVFGLFLLLVVEFALKILFNQDITANVTHVVIFFTTWFLSAKFLKLEKHDQKIGELKIERKSDVFLALLIAIHGLIMILFFYEKLTRL